MKLIKFKHRWDYGHDFYVTLLKFEKWCVFHGCFYTAVYGRTFPYLNIVMGSVDYLKLTLVSTSLVLIYPFLQCGGLKNET